jgi:hypothetical protein
MPSWSRAIWLRDEARNPLATPPLIGAVSPSNYAEAERKFACNGGKARGHLKRAQERVELAPASE